MGRRIIRQMASYHDHNCYKLLRRFHWSIRIWSLTAEVVAWNYINSTSLKMTTKCQLDKINHKLHQITLFWHKLVFETQYIVLYILGFQRLLLYCIVLYWVLPNILVLLQYKIFGNPIKYRIWNPIWNPIQMRPETSSLQTGEFGCNVHYHGWSLRLALYLCVVCCCKLNYSVCVRSQTIDVIHFDNAICKPWGLNGSFERRLVPYKSHKNFTYCIGFWVP